MGVLLLEYMYHGITIRSGIRVGRIENTSQDSPVLGLLPREFWDHRFVIPEVRTSFVLRATYPRVKGLAEIIWSLGAGSSLDLRCPYVQERINTSIPIEILFTFSFISLHKYIQFPSRGIFSRGFHSALNLSNILLSMHPSHSKVR